MYPRQCNTLQRYLSKKWHPLFTPIFSQAFLIGDVLISDQNQYFFIDWQLFLDQVEAQPEVHQEVEVPQDEDDQFPDEESREDVGVSL